MALSKNEARTISIAIRQAAVASMAQGQAIRHLAMGQLAVTGGDRDRAATEVAEVRKLLQQASVDFQEAFKTLEQLVEESA